jgi:hypothetical protein
MIPAIMSAFVSSYHPPAVEAPSETSPLIPTKPQISPSSSPSALAGILGLFTGFGALLSVFVFLRLPPILSKYAPSTDPGESLAWAIRLTFYIVSVIALLTSISLHFGLDCDQAKLCGASSAEEGGRVWVKREVGKLGNGFRAIGMDRDVGLAYVTSFCARSGSIVVS